MKIIFASHNLNKVREISNYLGADFEIVSLKDLSDYQEIEETGTTLSENALIKALNIYEKYRIPVFSDDSGLCVNALNGAPGVYSARYAGLEKDDAKNNAKLLRELANSKDRSAAFKTVIAFIAEGDQQLFEGTVTGEIALMEIGDQGFGYDPLFYPENQNRTFAEMSLEDKKKMSHRSRAMDQLKKYLMSHYV